MLFRYLLLAVTIAISLSPKPAHATTPADSLEFDSRFELYRYLQRGLEEYFDTGDTSLILQLNQAAIFVQDEYGDSFYVRQCRKFALWRNNSFSIRNKLKLQFSSNLSCLSGNRGPVDIYVSEMRELGDEFLEFGDSSSAATAWQHAASVFLTTELAENCLNRSLRICQLIGDLDGLSRSYNLAGRLLNEKMAFYKAGAYFDSARTIRAELGDNAGVAEGLNNIASVYLSIGNKAGALRYGEECLAVRRELGDSSLVYQSLVSVISAFARDVAPVTLSEWITAAADLYKSQAPATDAGRFQYCRALVAELQGDPDSAVALYKGALEIARAAKNNRVTLAVLQSSAALQSSLGSYTQALEQYLQAEDLATTSRNRVALATIYHNLGALHQKLGDIESAIDYYQRSLAIRQQFDLRLQTSETLSNLADLYLSVGDTSASYEYVQKAGEIALLNGDYREIGNSLIGRARLAQVQGNHEMALQWLDSAAVLSGFLTLQRRFDLLCLKADFIRQDRKFARAQDLLARAELLLDSCLTYSNCQKIDIINSALAVDERQWQTAYGFLARVIARSEKSRGTIPDPQLRGSFQTQARSVYEQMVNTLYHIRQSGNKPAYDDSLLLYIEKAKSRGLLDIIANRGFPTTGSQPAASAAVEHQLLREIEQLESSLADDSIPASVRSKVAKLSALEQKLTDLRLKSNVMDASARRVYSPSPISIKQLQSMLPDDRTLLVSYLLAPDQSYAVLISRSHFRVEQLSGRQVLTNSISEYMRLIQLSIKDDRLLDSLDIVASRVGQLLLPASLLTPDSIDRILISADGVLSILPFEALKLNDKYLIEYAAVATLPSIFLFTPEVLAHPDIHDWRILAIADPRSDSPQRQLPFSAREVDWICDSFGPDHCTILSASNATKADLLRLRLADYQVIHAATHSSINYRDPSRSKIWLSADTIAANNESYLTLAEVDNLKLNASLVVLSSCESGGGKLDFSEGMDGFVKAFMQAGARNMLVSLWEVEDFTTATFMKTFYQNISSGYAEALRSARLEMINSPRLRHRHPYYWSPFTLTVGAT